MPPAWYLELPWQKDRINIQSSSLFPHANCGDLKLLINLLTPLRWWSYRLGAYHPAWFRWYWSHGLRHSRPTLSRLSYISSCLNRSTWSRFVFLFQDPNWRKTCYECLSRILEPSFLGKELLNGSPLSYLILLIPCPLFWWSWCSLFLIPLLLGLALGNRHFLLLKETCILTPR